SRYDIVVYGATGVTGVVIVRMLATEELFKGKSIAVAGRNRGKLRWALEEIAQDTGNKDVRDFPIIEADNSNEESLANMAKKAKVIINAVGPYTLYGEAVIRAAVENGANHVDVSAENAFIEGMALKYGDLAKKNGVYIVGACGLCAIPNDLGIDYMKRYFDGTLGYVETCLRLNRGPSGYSFNTATCDSLLLGIQSLCEGGERAVHDALTPQQLPPARHNPPWRCPLTKFKMPSFEGWAMPLVGADKPIVERSQYYDYTVNGKRPVQVATYFSVGSLCQSMLLGLWFFVFGFFAIFSFTRKYLSTYAETLSFGMFKSSGPSREQQKEASFDCFIFGTGWAVGETANWGTPTKKMTLKCHGPDPGYAGASVCLTSSALALLDDKDKLPNGGGVFTTASAFRNTRIFEYMRKMGVSFEVVS
ncbi:hypothetical protein PMAYCL1PPCAC_00896, partial [Pristionchus mayeri]